MADYLREHIGVSTACVLVFYVWLPWLPCTIVMVIVTGNHVKVDHESHIKSNDRYKEQNIPMLLDVIMACCYGIRLPWIRYYGNRCQCQERPNVSRIKKIYIKVFCFRYVNS